MKFQPFLWAALAAVPIVGWSGCFDVVTRPLDEDGSSEALQGELNGLLQQHLAKPHEDRSKLARNDWAGRLSAFI